MIKSSHTYRSEIDLNDEHDYSDFVSSFVNHEDIAVYNDGMAIGSFNIFCLWTGGIVDDRTLAYQIKVKVQTEPKGHLGDRG